MSVFDSVVHHCSWGTYEGVLGTSTWYLIYDAKNDRLFETMFPEFYYMEFHTELGEI